MNRLFLLPIMIIVSGCGAVNHRALVPGGAEPVTIGNSSADIEITRAIRRSLVADPSISIPGRNVIVTTRSGVVTLSGAVKDPDERDDIHAKASVVPGISGIRNNLLPLSPTTSGATITPSQEP